MRGRNEHEYLAAHGVFRRGVCPDAADAERRVEEMRRRARQSTGEPEHTYSAPVQTIQPGRGSPCLWRRHWPGFCGSGVCGFNIAYR